jgi:N-methylhydantoinase A
VHAYGLAKLLKLSRIVCPLGAGVTSALGFLVAAPAIDYVRSTVTRLETADWDHINRLFDDMEKDARALLVESGTDPGRITLSRRADMRYVGQGFEIRVPLPDGKFGADSVADLRRRFLETYEQLFDRRIEDVPIEALTWRLSATAPVPSIHPNFSGHGTGKVAAAKGRRRVHFPDAGYVDCTVYDRYGLTAGASYRGPAVVEERESTTVIGPDARFSIDKYMNLIIDIA